MCHMNEIDCEIHVMFLPLYNGIRATHFDAALSTDNEFNSFSNMGTFLFLVDNEGIIRNFIKACYSILHKRRNVNHNSFRMA